MLAVGTISGVQLLDQEFHRVVQIDDGIGWVYNLSWSHNGQVLAVTTEECGLMIWEIEPQPKPIAQLHDNNVCYAIPEWSPSNRWLAFRGYFESVYTIDLTQPELLSRISGAIRRFEWNPAHDWLALTLTDDTIRVFDPERNVFIWRTDAAGVDITWSPNGVELAAVIESGIKTVLWTGEVTQSWVKRPAYHGIRIWDLQDNSVRWEIEIADNFTRLHTIEWLPNNLIGGRCDVWNEHLTERICLWNFVTAQRSEFSIASGSASAGWVYWSPDGTQFGVTIERLAPYSKIYRLENSQTEFADGWDGTWTPDNRYVTTISDVGELSHYDTVTDTSAEYPVYAD